MSSKVYQSELGLKNKIGRFLWGCVYSLLFRPSPRVFHAWRCWLLNCFGSDIASTAKVYPSARIWAPWNLTMDAASILGDRVDCYCVAPIKIGKGAVVSQDACLCAATHDYLSPDFTLIPKSVVIEEKAWVAARAFIGPGVNVGARAVIGACAVVFKDVPEGAVMVGNPARERSKKLS